VRYNILDTGGLIPYETMMAFLAEWGFDPAAELHQYGERGIRRTPFVYVFGRTDFTVSYFGANIYPENVTVGLEQPEVSGWVTGKFVLEVKEDVDHNRFLFVTVELAPGVEDDAEKQRVIGESILAQLRRLNSEFANYTPPEYQLPRITLLPAGNPEYFPIGVKHRYTRK
jgi:phenylacetate-CoA ligase